MLAIPGSLILFLCHALQAGAAVLKTPRTVDPSTLSDLETSPTSIPLSRCHSPAVPLFTLPLTSSSDGGVTSVGLPPSPTNTVVLAVETPVVPVPGHMLIPVAAGVDPATEAIDIDTDTDLNLYLADTDTDPTTTTAAAAVATAPPTNTVHIAAADAADAAPPMSMTPAPAPPPVDEDAAREFQEAWGDRYTQTTYWTCQTAGVFKGHCGWHEPIIEIAASAGARGAGRGGGRAATAAAAAAVAAVGGLLFVVGA